MKSIFLNISSWRLIMRNIIPLFILTVALSYFSSGPVSAQNTDVEKGLEFYVGWGPSKIASLDYEGSDVGGGTSYSGFSFGVNYNLNTIINPLVQISYYGVKEPFYGVDSGSKIWYLMGGVRLQSPGSPVYLNILSGLNRHIYTDFTFQGREVTILSDDDNEQSSISLNNFATEIEIGGEIRLNDSLLIRIGGGYNNVHSRGKILDNIFVRLSGVYEL